MSELPDESVHMVCTSPPYWGLRRYAGVADSVFDGNPLCQHEWGKDIETGDNRFRAPSGSIVGANNNPDITKGGKLLSQFCLKCNAWRGQLGQEPTPELYIKHIVDIFREVKRVLRSDGVCFVNIGDSYNSGEVGRADKSKYGGKNKLEDLRGGIRNHPVIKIQDKCLIPFRLAIALQEQGWWVRQDIIWQKNNPMPESVSSPRWVKHRIKVRDSSGYGGTQLIWQDCPGCEKCLPNDGLVLRHGSWRPTESHEYILMLTKSNDYYCDGEVVRERLAYGADSSRASAFNNPSVRKDDSGEQTAGLSTSSQDAYYAKVRAGEVTGRNLRSVWTFSTQSYAGTHYATFPEKLPELCIKAGTSEYGVCAECGKPWVRIIQSKQGFTNGICNICGESRNKHIQSAKSGMRNSSVMLEDNAIACSGNQTLGWRATCSCRTDKLPVGAVVLDPFCGTGTTLAVAKRLGRQGIGYELSEDYCKLTVKRIEKETAPMRGL